MLLSQLRPAQALPLALAAWKASAGGNPLRSVAAQAAAGLAMIRTGKGAAGRDLCTQALRTAEASGHPAAISMAMVALAEAGLQNPALAREHCDRYGHRELAFRARLLEGAAFDAEAKALSALWGDSAFALYAQRPDVKELIAKRK